MNQNILEFWLNGDPEGIAIEDYDHEILYRKLEGDVNKRVLELQALGIQRNDHVAIYIYDQITYLNMFLALWKLDATIVPIDSQIGLLNLLKITQYADIHYIITDKNFSNINGDVLLYPNLSRIIKINDNGGYEIINVNPENEKKSWLKERFCDCECGYFMLFTSGTSSEAKGVVLKKKSFINNVSKVIKYTSLRSDDVLLLNLPLTYSFALSQLIAHLIVGGKIVFSKNNMYNSLIFLEIKQKQITNYAATPYFYEVILKEAGSKKQEMDIGRLRFLMNAGGYLSPRIVEGILKLFPNIIFFNNYGQTEASPRICYNKIDITSSDYKSVGQAVPGVKIKIFDDKGKETSDIGEIGYKSEDFMLGYYKKEELLLNQYFMSGDLGYMEDSKLVIVGRKDSLIKINGRKVYKNYIEDLIYELPFVKNVKVKKEQHETFGEYFVTYIVPEDKFDPVEVKEKLYMFCKRHFSTYEMPKKIIICSEISLSSNKKVVFKDVN